MTRPPTFDDIFAVMSAASVGDADARVPVPDDADLDDIPTRFSIALNLLLDDLAVRKAEVEESEQRLATTLDSIGDAVIATDLEARVVLMNPVAEDLTGWTLREARGRPLTEVFRILNEETRRVVENPAERVLRDGVVVGLANHTTLVSRDGRERPIADSGAPIRDQRGDVHGVVLVFRDQSRERAAEAQRLRAVELEAASRRAEEASRLKSEFLANMSHELRTPLNAIIGFSELIHEEQVGSVLPRQKEFLGHVVSSGRHLLQLINDILDLSKVEAGRMSFSPEAFDPAALVAEVVAALRTGASARHLDLTSRCEPSVDAVVMDAGRLKQVLYNLVSNAIKFTPDGGHVDVTLLAQGGEYFRIEVADTGIGIAPADLDRLFVEFQQLDAGVSKGQGGTGLGLALTRRLVEAQGGSVGVKSVLGEGSVFHAVLPRRAGPSVATDPRPTVLVVEASEDERRAVVAALTAAGYAVDAAATASEAIAKCESRGYDALTLDLVLPDGSAFDFLHAVRLGTRNREVKVVVLAMVSEPGSVAGFAVSDVLARPCEPAALVASLQRAGVRPAPSGGVWVIDDDPASTELVAARLEQLEFQVVRYADCESALLMLEHAVPLAVVLDLLMPGMDGFQFLERFRKISACRGIPVIVWTVKDLSTDEHERLRASAQAIVAKGGGNVTLVEALRTHLPLRTRGG